MSLDSPKGVDPKLLDRIGNYHDVPFMCITMDVKLGERVVLRPFANLYGCTIGDDTKVGAFVEIQRDVEIGKRCKIQDFVSICTGVTIGDDVFIGPGVIFTNDRHPDPFSDEWTLVHTKIGNGVVIGAGAVIHPGASIGDGSFISAGAVVTKAIGPNTFVPPPTMHHYVRSLAHVPKPVLPDTFEPGSAEKAGNYKTDLLAWLHKNFYVEIGKIDLDRTYMEQGLLDSTGVLELVQYIEETYGFRVEDDEIIEENLGGVNKTVEYIKRKLAAKS